jgi:hypothetical protein
VNSLGLGAALLTDIHDWFLQLPQIQPQLLGAPLVIARITLKIDDVSKARHLIDEVTLELLSCPAGPAASDETLGLFCPDEQSR